MQRIRSAIWHRPGGASVVAVALLLFSPVAAYAEPNVPVPPSELISDDGEGTVSAADKDLIVKVRLAGLWEIPAGEMAQQKSNDPRIQKIGRDIAKQHELLDVLDRAAAKKLKIALPNKPNADQQKWLAEMRDAEGAEFDEIYIDRLRAAHGKIFPAIGTVRATTRNDTVRKLAQQANQFVVTHLTLLESSDIVDFAALPTAPNPAAAANSAPATAVRPVPAANDSPLSGTNPAVVILRASWRSGRVSMANQFAPEAASSRPRWRPRFLPAGGQISSPPRGGAGSVQGFDAVSCGGLVEAVAVTLGHNDVSVVQEPIDRGGGQGLGHDLVEA
jgi:putative membrane protein